MQWLIFSLYSILFINMYVHIAPTPGSSMLSASASSSSSWIRLHAGRLRHDHLIGHGSFEAMWKLGSHEKKAKKWNNNACQLFLAHGVIWKDASMFQMWSFMHVIYIYMCVCVLWGSQHVIHVWSWGAMGIQVQYLFKPYSWTHAMHDMQWWCFGSFMGIH